MVAAPGMLVNAGKKLKEACATRAVPARFTCHSYPPNQSGIARRKRQPRLSLLLYYYSLLCLDRPSTGAVVGRFECFVFLFLAFICKAFCYCFLGTVIFWSFLDL